MGELLSFYKNSSNININALLYAVYNYAEIITVFFHLQNKNVYFPCLTAIDFEPIKKNPFIYFLTTLFI